ncbi:MAG: YjjG family noncanonical pyrimidine nucleotidase [Oscillospiraceae bacterium]|nr:YjjG family noncanonical pyrimidine nucleotidase [Oscillospiraceae bacterium]
MIKVVLWDIDGTLLSFKMAERAAIRACFEKFGLGELTDEMLAEYSAINASYWKRLELGELTKQQVLRGRFEEFFAAHELDTGCVDAFNAEYQVRLGETVVFNDNGKELVQRLRGKVKQYAVTNGTLVAQRGKLKNSGLDLLLDGVFISDVVGVEKPGKGFFDAVFAAIGDYEKDEVLIVGDSLTSDIQGGNNAGILCGWYNPGGQPVPDGLRVDYDIRDLNAVEIILELEG